MDIEALAVCGFEDGESFRDSLREPGWIVVGKDQVPEVDSAAARSDEAMPAGTRASPNASSGNAIVTLRARRSVLAAFFGFAPVVRFGGATFDRDSSISGRSFAVDIGRTCR